MAIVCRHFSSDQAEPWGSAAPSRNKASLLATFDPKVDNTSASRSGLAVMASTPAATASSNANTSAPDPPASVSGNKTAPTNGPTSRSWTSSAVRATVGVSLTAGGPAHVQILECHEFRRPLRLLDAGPCIQTHIGTLRIVRVRSGQIRRPEETQDQRPVPTAATQFGDAEVFGPGGITHDGLLSLDLS